MKMLMLSVLQVAVHAVRVGFLLEWEWESRVVCVLSALWISYQLYYVWSVFTSYESVIY